MTDQPANPEQGDEQAVQVDEVKLQHFLQNARDNQNLAMGIAGGAGAAFLGACIWALITHLTGFQIGWMAVGVGFMVGFAVRYFGRGIDKVFGIVGALLSLIGCLAGNLFAVCAVLAEQENMQVMDVVSQLDLDLMIELMTATFSPIDLLFYGIGIYEGYKYSFRKITEEEMSRLV